MSSGIETLLLIPRPQHHGHGRTARHGASEFRAVMIQRVIHTLASQRAPTAAQAAGGEIGHALEDLGENGRKTDEWTILRVGICGDVQRSTRQLKGGCLAAPSLG